MKNCREHGSKMHARTTVLENAARIERIANAPARGRGGRPTKSEAALLSEHILASALGLFSSHGVERTTMDAIATAATVSKRTLYCRFGSKQELVRKAVEIVVARMLLPLGDGTKHGTIHEQLCALADDLLEIALKPETHLLHELTSWLAAADPALHDGVKRLVLHQPIAMFAAILDEAALPEASDRCFAASFFFDALVTVPKYRILNCGMARDPETRAAYHRQAVDLLLAGVGLRAGEGQASATPQVATSA
jgi:TetR/AcrR family transcriptional regulator, mexJK operon transcriptional repressor